MGRKGFFFFSKGIGSQTKHKPETGQIMTPSIKTKRNTDQNRRVPQRDEWQRGSWLVNFTVGTSSTVESCPVSFVIYSVPIFFLQPFKPYIFFLLPPLGYLLLPLPVSTKSTFPPPLSFFLSIPPTTPLYPPATRAAQRGPPLACQHSVITHCFSPTHEGLAWLLGAETTYDLTSLLH